MLTVPETVKLFDQNAYAEDFSATVLSAERIVKTEKKGKKKKKEIVTWEVILDRTLFFPEEGGQTPDTGVLGGYPVTDVQLEGNVIRHTVLDNCGEDELFAVGQTVSGRIDFARRFSNMQNHSGEHILSGLVHGRFGYDNVGFHLSDNTVTLDFNGPLTEEDILWLEQTANRVVWDNKEIRAWYPDPEELKKTVYRSKKEIDGPLRLVEIPGVDMCACCAPHVRRTGEIGLIKIIRILRERSGIRLTILCGSRALAYMQTLQKAAEDVSHLTNMPREEIAAGTARILEDNDKLRQREAQLEAMMTAVLARSVPPGQKEVFLFAEGLGNLAQRRLVNTLCESHEGYCGVWIGNDQDGYRYIIGAGTESSKVSGDSTEGAGTEGNGAEPANTRDARVLNACLHKACGARGGGSPAMVQGSVMAAEAEIRRALEEALYERP